MFSSREHLDLIPADSDVCIYAVRDEALTEVISRVHTNPRTIHIHTSGTMPLTVFGNDKPHAGIFYPFQSFSKAQPIDDFSNVPILIEARQIDDLSAIYTIAQTLSHSVFEASQTEREMVHVAGVFANNFSNLMCREAEAILRHTSLPFRVLLPLIDETAHKLHTLSPADAQTGPAHRGDTRIMEHHMSLLTEEQRCIYQLLSHEIQNLKS